MKTVRFIAFSLLLSFNLQSQSYTLSLRDTTLQTFTRINLVADSIEDNKGERNYYFSVSASKLIPSRENFSDLIFRIKISDKEERIEQFFLNVNTGRGAINYKNKSKHKFLMLDSLNPANNFFLELTLNLENDRLSLSTMDAFWGSIALGGDTLVNFVIHPYFIPQNNIILDRTSLADPHIDNKEFLQFGEPFELSENYYKLLKTILREDFGVLTAELCGDFA
jgi:hypothetical protein